MIDKEITKPKSTHAFFVRLKRILSPSLKFAIKWKINALKNLIQSFYCWQWKKHQFYSNVSQTTEIQYLGKSASLLSALLGLEEAKKQTQKVENKFSITDFPVPRAYCIPATLTTIVPLHRTVEEIISGYASSLRRSIIKQRAQYRYETITDTEKMADIEKTMLRPYANARHENANHVSFSEIVKLALSENGRLYLLYCGEEVVGCQLANFYERDGKKYWHVNRFGYPENVFSDYKRWSEVNSLNLHLALEAAIDEGFDYCDYGTSLAKPGAGLIEWKRRRKGFLAQDGGVNFYLSLPKNGIAQFFWDSPLFAIEKNKVTLHLGIPEGKTDDDVKAKFHEMGYGGLYKVYLNCVTTPSEALVQSIRALFSEEKEPPMVITYFADQDAYKANASLDYAKPV